MNNLSSENMTDNVSKNIVDTEKKAYATPELIEHGSLIEIVQAGAGGNADTANSNSYN